VTHPLSSRHLNKEKLMEIDQLFRIGAAVGIGLVIIALAIIPMRARGRALLDRTFSHALPPDATETRMCSLFGFLVMMETISVCALAVGLILLFA
jgi:hypothetical protein